MAVLRSRKSVPGRSPSETLEKEGSVEPLTPNKTDESSARPQPSPSRLRVSAPPSPPSAARESAPAPVRRRSLRLASKSSPRKGGTGSTPVPNGVDVEKNGGNLSRGSDGENDFRVSEGRTGSSCTPQKEKEKRKFDDCPDEEVGDGHGIENEVLRLRSGAKIAKIRYVTGVAVENGSGGSACGQEMECKVGDVGGEDVGPEELEKESATVAIGLDFPPREKRFLGEANVDLTGGDNDDGESFKERPGKEVNDRNKGILTDESVEDPAAMNEHVGGRRRFSKEEKGKRKLDEDPVLSNGDPMESDAEHEEEDIVDNTVSDVSHPKGPEVLPVMNMMATNEWILSRQREQFRHIAKENAVRFAYFDPQEEEDSNPSSSSIRESPSREASPDIEDWPGPFSTAMKIIKDRAMNVKRQHLSNSNKSMSVPVIWNRRGRQDGQRLKPLAPSLLDLCVKVLAKNAEAIASLESVPDELRNRLSRSLCDSRKMTSQVLELLFSGSPTEVRVRDCSWLTEEQFTRIFDGCDTNNLVVLQLDQCGRCLPDYILQTTLARSSNSLPALAIISLKGGCRISDAGLNALVSAAPMLKSINLGQCSLLSSTGIDTLADSLGSTLRELCIDDCQTIDAMRILPALKKLEHLEVLSVAGIQSVCDDFIKKLIAVHGQNMKKLILTDCVKLTDSSVKFISEMCPKLCALDLVHLSKLTDSAIQYLANGCPAIETLKLCRNAFSDEAVAAFLETCGESLIELSLNNVTEVGNNTGISLAQRARRLQSLDLSWCRKLTDEAMGLIVDSCSSLKVLKLFGCTQITNVFLDGHSNRQVKIVGLKMAPVLEHVWEL